MYLLIVKLCNMNLQIIRWEYNVDIRQDWNVDNAMGAKRNIRIDMILMVWGILTIFECIGGDVLR